MAPILALVSYGMTGYFQTTVIHTAGDYQLHLDSECRPKDNLCVMKSGNIEIMLISSIKQGKQQLGIVANQSISYLSVALAKANNNFVQFKIMKSDDKKYWQIVLNENQKLEGYLKFRLAGHSKKSNYYIEDKIIL